MEPLGIESSRARCGLVQSRGVSDEKSATSEWRRGRWRRVSSGLVTVHCSTVVGLLEGVLAALERGDVAAARVGTEDLLASFSPPPLVVENLVEQSS